jgi:hypothetical protein
VPVSPHVHDAATVAGTALLDLGPWRGRWRHLTPEAEPLWARLRAGLPEEEAVLVTAREVAARHPEVSESRAAADQATLLGALRAGGLVTDRRRRACPPAPVPRSEPPLPGAAFEPAGVLTAADRVGGVVGLAVALLLIHTVPQRWTVAAAARLARTARHDATVSEGERAVRAVRWAAAAWPGRCACLEESIGAFLAGFLRRRRLRLVLGCGHLPPAPHAWVEAEGRPVGQKLTGNAWDYTPALRI